MSVEEDWARVEELVQIDPLSKIQGDELRDLLFRLVSTAEGRRRIVAGLGEPLVGKVKAISRLVDVLETRHVEAGLTREDRLRLLEHLSVAGAPYKGKVPYWTILWMRHEAGDPKIGSVIAEAFRKVADAGGKKQPLSQRLSQQESWKRTPPRYQGDLLGAALEAESNRDFRQQLQEALRSFPAPRRPSEAQPGQTRRGISESIPNQVESRISPVPAAERPTAGPSEVPSQLHPRTEVIPEGSPPTPADPGVASPSPGAANSPTPPGGEEEAEAAEPSRRPFAPPLASGREGRPKDDRVPDTASAEGPKGKSAPADTDAEVSELPRKTRSSRPVKGDPASTPADHGDPAQQVAELLNQYLPHLAALPRLNTHLAALTGEVRDLGGRLSRPEERAGELAPIREELRRTRDDLRECQRSLDEALRERDRLLAKNQETAARIQEAQEQIKVAEGRADQRIKLAEDRADQHIHQANQDREHSVQNYLASLRPTLRRLLIDIEEKPHEDGANPPSETESLLWKRLSEIKQALKDRGVLLD